MSQDFTPWVKDGDITLMRETKRCVRRDSCDGQQSPSFLLCLKHFNFCIVRLWRDEGGKREGRGREGEGGVRREGGRREEERERNRRRKVGSQTHPLKLLIIAVLSTGAPRATANE